ncbi:MAG: hypothetical protein HZA88_09160 [Verrucomicrobia bacterium]|nr:hypothetical protein [Verrucomicrobiota bacterium]
MSTQRARRSLLLVRDEAGSVSLRDGAMFTELRIAEGWNAVIARKTEPR